MKTHTRLTVYRDNEDLRAKVSRGSRRRLRKSSRDKVEKQEPEEGLASRALAKKRQDPLNYVAVANLRRETGIFCRGKGSPSMGRVILKRRGFIETSREKGGNQLKPEPCDYTRAVIIAERKSPPNEEACWSD